MKINNHWSCSRTCRMKCIDWSTMTMVMNISMNSFCSQANEKNRPHDLKWDSLVLLMIKRMNVVDLFRIVWWWKWHRHSATVDWWSIHQWPMLSARKHRSISSLHIKVNLRERREGGDRKMSHVDRWASWTISISFTITVGMVHLLPGSSHRWSYEICKQKKSPISSDNVGWGSRKTKDK